MRSSRSRYDCSPSHRSKDTSIEAPGDSLESLVTYPLSPQTAHPITLSSEHAITLTIPPLEPKHKPLTTNSFLIPACIEHAKTYLALEYTLDEPLLVAATRTKSCAIDPVSSMSEYPSGGVYRIHITDMGSIWLHAYDLGELIAEFFDWRTSNHLRYAFSPLPNAIDKWRLTLTPTTMISSALPI
jgi:hypothetical protein